MIHPANFEQKIEFDAVRKMVEDKCISTMGIDLVKEIAFQTDPGIVSGLLDETIEFKDILTHGEGFPAQDYYDLREELGRLRVEGSCISLEILLDLRSSLGAMEDIVEFTGKYRETEIPRMKQIVGDLHIDPMVLRSLDAILDERGNIRDNASKELANIRKSLMQKGNAVNRKMAQSLKSAKQQGWISADAEATIRDGRQVLPVPASQKRSIQGVIVDESATGQTVYIEPAEVLALNNEIRELKGSERREIIRILKSFTNDIRPLIPELIEAYEVLGRIDLIRSKALLAIRINGTKPTLDPKPGINWVDAVHPLLFLIHKKQKKEIVPLSINIDETGRILVISGPNAGGKSVCLKTVGLLQYMLQCGFPVPLKEGSSSGIFKDLFIDIGDEQSLENDLSTYSSHLLNMRTFVENGNANSLFLIDEFGTGTEPRLGGAIAEAVLEALNDRKCFGVVTTHYSNLKLQATEGNGIVNGAMLFDTRKMEPLYRLSIGRPGSSFAFEIARKIGFPEKLLSEAEKKSGKKQLDFDQQLHQLELEKKDLEQQKKEFEVADTFLSELIEKYEKLTRTLEDQKKMILANAEEEAFNLLQSSNRKIEQTIREIRESQAEKRKTKGLRQSLKDEQEKIRDSLAGKQKDKAAEKARKVKANKTEKPDKIKDDRISVGDRVHIPEQNVYGEVLSVSGDDIVIGFNSISFRTRLDKVVKASAGERQKPSPARKKSSYGKIADQVNDKMANFNMQLDIRGMRGEEAMEKVRHFIDDAVMLNIREVSILHGKGYGILRNLVHDHLRSVPEVRQFRDEHIERGGHGITIVILK